MWCVCVYTGVAKHQSSLKVSYCGGFCSVCGECECSYTGVAKDQSPLEETTKGVLFNAILLSVFVGCEC